jgi:calcineurin-like phosphoesterase family protein
VLSHHPLVDWHPETKNDYQIYGHIHNNFNDPNWEILRDMDSALNACVEINNYAPATLDELIENNAAFKASLRRENP